MTRPDVFTDFEHILESADLDSPWIGDPATYRPDFDLLTKLLRVPLASSAKSESGRFAKAIDTWLAHEFRRAGFAPDAVWPRATKPRVLSTDIATLIDKITPRKLGGDIARKVADLPSVGPTDAKFLGRAYVKQVDVAIASWATGPELLLSTKAMTSSFGKNLPNRFEEAYGDAANLRERHPLAAVGFLFLQRATILQDEPAAYERTVDMMRKLRDTGKGVGYTSTGLVLVDYDDNGTTVQVREDQVPEDLRAGAFLGQLIDHMLDVTPIVHHVDARERRIGRALATDAEADDLPS